MTMHSPRAATRIALVIGATLALAVQAKADQVIPDDLIVQGSLCVGFDCVNNENFGFDTIKLKENNLRVLFQDTSVGTFPSNDWRLIANDSFSGGASYFALEDATAAKIPFTVFAGAPTHSMFVASTGKVGFRTSTPVLDLHVSTSDTPAHRFEQTNAGGFPAQTWDVAGNEANFFVRDVTGGSRLPLRIRPGAPTSSLDIAANGNVGIGTGSASRKLEIVGEDPCIKLRHTGTGTQSWLMCNGTAASNDGKISLFDETAASARFTIDTSGNAGLGTTAPTAKLDVNGTVRVATLGGNPPANTVCFSAANVLGTCASDSRLKHNVRYLQESAGLNAVMKLKPATFQWQDGDARMMAGFIAQETLTAIPEAVHKPAGSEFLSLDSAAILSYAVRAIQELKADNDRLRGDIERLKASR